MKAKLDKNIAQVQGLKIQLKGRYRGSKRSRKIVKIWGKLRQANVLTRVSFHSSTVITKYGCIGLKVWSSMKYKSAQNRKILLSTEQNTE